MKLPPLPPHWWINGPGEPRAASELFRWTRVRGGHASTYRRLFRIGPWSVAVIRYRPGDDPTVPTIPTSATPAVVRRRSEHTGPEPECCGEPTLHRGDATAEHLRPLLALTPEELDALRAAATAWWGEPGPARPSALASALRKITTTEQPS